MSDFELVGKRHPYLPNSGWGPQARADIPKNAPQLPDVNPTNDVVARLEERFGGNGAGGLFGGAAAGVNGDAGGGGGGGGGSGRDGLNGANGLNGLDGRVSSIEQRLGNISAVCNGDGTITITI